MNAIRQIIDGLRLQDPDALPEKWHMQERYEALNTIFCNSSNDTGAGSLVGNYYLLMIKEEFYEC